MRRLVVGFIALTLFLTSCSTFQSSDRTPASTQYFVDPQYYDFQVLVAESLDFRAEALKFAESKKLNETSQISLTRTEGEWLREKGRKYLELRKKLVDLAIKEGELFDGYNSVKLNAYKGTSTKTHNMPGDYERRPHTQQPTFTVMQLDPTDKEGEQRFFRMQMALSAALLLMDNYLVAIQPYNENSSLRYVLNYDTSERRALQQIADSYSSPSRRLQVEKGIKFIDEVMAWRRAKGIETSPEESFLYGLTQSSIWYLAVKNGQNNSSFKDAIVNLWNRITLRGKRGVRVVSYGVSMGFGNMVGLVETRKGYLHNMPASEKEALIAEMQPLDILMEKTPFRLTDKMIPGHYGHVAIWLGTESQLRDLKVWDQIPKNIQDKIRSGHRIVEALRPGVQINTLEHFLNIDDFLVIRDKRQVSDDYRRKAILQAVAQIGKEYDFNFDVATHERIVCSEIAYVVYSDVKWPLEEMVRRYTISPDNVAQLAVGNNPVFEPVIMYYGGKRYFKNLPYSLSLLLKATDQSYADFERFQNL
ncbi:YiiX/YebB-like N1pC/P60 family cysteine hydrolase [Bdellovibrio sp. ArHS]|uniref:YiiX/YebB-like N1pC/P60 family cysteine hydrolase n=1 Tax=Bdellovibrio sp. ArHS TaxID=1569284 RepID=UPI000A829686|nr:YiiX/YebB-like N1pC/P60 family cysteine hydrolase [Bdellovibrio sp. ArHS]